MSKSILSRIFVISILAAAAVMFWPERTSAQMAGVRFSPTRFEEMVDPGDVVSRRIKLKNISDSELALSPYLRDFTAEGETGRAQLYEPSAGDPYSLSAWIEMPDASWRLLPDEEIEIDFNIRVPEGIGPGGYYGAIIFGTPPPDVRVEGEDKGAAISIAQQTGPLVLLQVRGKSDERASVREFTTDKDVYSLPAEVIFLARIENHGNVHIKPRGQIAIQNMFGREVASLPFNDRSSNILPKSIRRFEESWSNSRGFGRYTATIALSYGVAVDLGGQGKQTLYSEKTFWIIPWKLVIPGILGLILTGILFGLMLRFYKSKAVRRAMQQMGLGYAGTSRRYTRPSPVFHFGMIFMVLMLSAFLFGFVFYFILFA